MAVPIDTEYMGENVKSKLKKCGENVAIHPLAKIIRPEMIEMDDFAQVDDFTFIYGGQGIKIGKYCHIPAFCSIVGGGEFEIGDCSALTAGVRIVTGTDDYHGGTFMSSPCPPNWRNPKIGKIIIGPGSFIGTNSVVLPDVTIGECVVVGALSMVNKDLEPYGIYVGSPARKIGTRDEINPQIVQELKEKGINSFN
jgi:galactoside O-acetyltransferase